MRVTALGARCDYAGEVPQEDGRVGLSFAISEWLETDQRRVTLHDGFGFTSVLITDDDPWTFHTEQSLTEAVLNVVLPEDDDPDDAGEEHPWTWLAELAEEQRISTTPDALRALAYRVELGPELSRRLATAPGGTP